MHGIVYVPESEAPSDPLENEGAFSVGLQILDMVVQEGEKSMGGWEDGINNRAVADCEMWLQ